MKAEKAAYVVAFQITPFKKSCKCNTVQLEDVLISLNARTMLPPEISALSVEELSLKLLYVCNDFKIATGNFTELSISLTSCLVITEYKIAFHCAIYEELLVIPITFSLKINV